MKICFLITLTFLAGACTQQQNNGGWYAEDIAAINELREKERKAALGALLWTRFETSEKQINYWFLLYLRLYLGLTMFAYGLAKVLPLQMHGYELSRLLVTIGDSTR